jgi:predicted aconitase
MFLTDEEKQMFDGTKGPAVQKAMQILVTLGEGFEAKRLLKIESVHMAGASIMVTGEAGAMFVEHMQEQGGHFTANVTTNPSAIDSSQWRELGIDESDAGLQGKLTGAYAKMGAVTCNTCTPYLVGSAPRFGEHIAWGESSAVVFVNSVLGARSNREGGPSCLASALTSRTPEYGFHLQENRYGALLINIVAKLRDMTDYGTMGAFVGKIAGADTPVFAGMPADADAEDLKALSAALASSGAVSMFHAIGITPEAPTLEVAFNGCEPAQVVEFGEKELAATEAELNKYPTEDVDWIHVGCPNASIREMKEVADRLEGKKIHDGITLWVSTSGAIYAMAEQAGYIDTIKDAGGQIVRETCPFMAPSRALAAKRGYRSLATNSAKMAYYAPGQFGLLPHYGNLERLVSAAINGTWR